MCDDIDAIDGYRAARIDVQIAYETLVTAANRLAVPHSRYVYSNKSHGGSLSLPNVNHVIPLTWRIAKSLAAHQ